MTTTLTSYDEVLSEFAEEEVDFSVDADDVNLLELEKAAEGAPVVRLVNAILLNAIKKAIGAGSLQKIEIVLGPNDRDPDVERMKSLLGFACKGSQVDVKVLPLFVEDYLSFSAVSL